MYFQPGLVVARGCVDIFGVSIQRDERSVNDEDISKVFETPSELVSVGVEILDRESLARGNESRLEPLVKRCVREGVAVSIST